MNQVSKAILRTIAYADIFDYPLTRQEISKFLISDKKQGISEFLISEVAQNNGFYFLKGREQIVATRRKREQWSRGKIKIVQRVAELLKLVPTIKMVAVTGALAMNNADRNDDIDLLIVAAKNQLWLTRLLAVFLTEIIARRRRPGDKVVADKICLNMFLDENYLAVPKNERDLFSAHEVVQLRPIWDKDGIYDKFIRQNRWLSRYLANWKL